MNVLTGSKECGNQHGTTISLSLRELEVNGVKKFAFVWSEILRLFVNTLTADDKYSRRNVENLRQQFETPLSEKQKTFSGFFIAFLKCAWNFAHFQKKKKKMSILV